MNEHASVNRAVDATGGVWVAYYGDRSGMYPFASEIEALRFAVDRSATVAFVKWGAELLEDARQ